MCHQPQGGNVMTNSISRCENGYAWYSKHKKTFLFWWKRTNEITSLRKWGGTFLDIQLLLVDPHLCGWVQCYAKEKKPKEFLHDVLFWLMSMQTEYPIFCIWFFPPISFVWQQQKRCFPSSMKSRLIL